HVLSWQGRHEEALGWARQAVEADPLSNLMKGNLGYILMDAGEFDRAIAIDDELLEREPNSSRMRNLWLTYLRAGRPEEAANALERWASATDRDPEAAEEVGGLFIQYKDTGEPAFLSSDLVARLEIGSEDLAQVYAFIGDRESTLAALESAYRERSGSRSVLSMKVNPGYDFVRDNPRFVELMRLVRLQE
ncbi:MAG: tetratricopeptide repeat protein, partial [Gammaproteobacteria bacterium]